MKNIFSQLILVFSVLFFASSFTLSIRQDKDSELALLMRSMYDDSELIRKAITTKKLPKDFRQKFAELHTAKPTDADVKNETYKAMGNYFLTNLEKVYTEKDQVKAFNLMVESCVACHKTFCPGPIKKIKKLTIEQK